MFEIFQRIKRVAYELVLPPDLLTLHFVIHVSMLKMYHYEDSHVIQ